jgi:hypothetical protein
MPDTPPSALPPLTLQEKRQIAIKFLSYPALSVMVFLRRRTGLRRVKPIELMITTAAVVFVAPVMGFVRSVAVPHMGFHPPSGISFFDFPTEMFAVLFLAAGLLQRHFRWREICQGARWHTRSSGVSYLASILPFSEATVQRFIDPLVCWLVGSVIAVFLSAQLGAWLMFSGFALFMVEQYDYERIIDRHLDMLDSYVESEVNAETIGIFARTNGTQAVAKPERLDATAGIPTGIAPELQVQIQKRRRMALAEPNMRSVA